MYLSIAFPTPSSSFDSVIHFAASFNSSVAFFIAIGKPAFLKTGKSLLSSPKANAFSQPIPSIFKISSQADNFVQFLFEIWRRVPLLTLIYGISVHSSNVKIFDLTNISKTRGFQAALMLH